MPGAKWRCGADSGAVRSRLALAAAMSALAWTAPASAGAGQGPSQAGAPEVRRARIVEKVTHTLANRERVRRGIEPLVWDERLARAARDHSRRMAAAGFFGHEDPERGTLSRRIQRTGLAWAALGENLHQAHGTRLLSAAHLGRAAVRGWMASPEHGGNLLSDRFDRTGIGAAFRADGTLLVTQVFAALRLQLHARATLSARPRPHPECSGAGRCPLTPRSANQARSLRRSVSREAR